MKLSRFFQVYVDFHVKRKCKESTIKRYQINCNRLEKITDIELIDVTKKEYDKIVEKYQKVYKSLSSTNIFKQHLKKIIKLAIEAKLIKEDIFLEETKSKPDKKAQTIQYTEKKESVITNSIVSDTVNKNLKIGNRYLVTFEKKVDFAKQDESNKKTKFKEMLMCEGKYKNTVLFRRENGLKLSLTNLEVIQALKGVPIRLY